MNFLQNLRSTVGFKLLGRKVDKLDRKKAFHNLKSAKSVGVLFYLSSQENYETSVKYVEKLISDGNNVTALGIKDMQKNISETMTHLNINIYNDEKSTVWCYPENSVVEEFVNTQFDILINICTEETLCVDYIMGLSKAEFKISPQLRDNRFADFILQFSEQDSKSASNIIKTIMQYLSSITKA